MTRVIITIEYGSDARGCRWSFPEGFLVRWVYRSDKPQ